MVRMQRLGFASCLAAMALLVALAVAGTTGVPFRDPDSTTGHTYIRLPVILMLALLLDVIPRIIGRADAVSDLPRTAVAVVHERWSRTNLLFTLTGLIAWYVTYASVRNLKGFVPFVNHRLYDSALARMDRAMFFGNDPATVLHHVLGTGLAAQVLSFFYLAWIVLLPLSLVVALVWHRETTLGSWWVTAVAVDWVLGVASNYALPTLGPIYVDPGGFSSLTQTATTHLQDAMWSERLRVLANPSGAHDVQNIAAFASLHVGIATTACLLARQAGLPRVLRFVLDAFLVVTIVATVYFGWHYAVDVIAGLVIGAAGAWIGAIATGHHRSQSSPHRRAEPSPAVPVFD
jgi:hypothetical protein